MYAEPPRYREMPGVVEDEIARKGKASPRIDLGETDKFPLARVVTNQVADAIISGKPHPVEIVLGFNTNFNMSAPGAERWDEALKKTPFYVHLAPFPSEMAQYADILLPATAYLEEWGYEHSLFGSAETRLKQPAVEPQFNAKSIVDVIFELGRRTGGSVARSFSGIGEDAEGFVRYRTSSLIDWGEFREGGVWAGPAYEYHKYSRIFKTPSKKFEFRSGNYEALAREKGIDVQGELAYLPHYEAPTFLGSEADYPFMLVTYHPVMGLWNGSQNYPWAQEIFLVMHGRGWDNFVEVNSGTAKACGFEDGDKVWVESPFGRLKVRARVFEGIHPQVVAISLGQGHYAYGKWQEGIGVNPNEIIGVDYDRTSGGAAFFNTRVKIYKA